MFSGEIVLGGRIVIYSAEAVDVKDFIRIVKAKVAAKYPKLADNVRVQKVTKL